MSQKIGAISWFDLTVPNAGELRSFYEKVVGWQSAPVNMGGYEDSNMNLPGSGETVAGICHALGPNAGLPPQWLMYITVEDVQHSVDECRAAGGKIIREPRKLGTQGEFCVIQDLAGAVVALFTPANK